MPCLATKLIAGIRWAFSVPSGRSHATFSRYCWSAWDKPRRGGSRGHQQFVQLGRLGQPFAIEIDSPGVMFAAPGIEPVAVDDVAVGIELAKEGIGNDDFPDIVLDFHPVIDDFRPFDLDLFAPCGLIDDAFGVGFAPARRVDAFAVNALMHRDHIAGLRELRGALDCAERSGSRSGVGVFAVDGNVKLSRISA